MRDFELEYYSNRFGSSIEAQMERHLKSRQKSRAEQCAVKRYYDSIKTGPDSTILQVGNKWEYTDERKFFQMAKILRRDIEEENEDARIKVLSISIHASEDNGSLHIHMTKSFEVKRKDGWIQNQEECLKKLGYKLPDKSKKKGQYNNRKMTWTDQPEERDRLIKYLKSIPQTRYTLACRLMACLPLRMGELRALTWEDYNEREMKLHIHHEIVKEKRNGKERCDVDVPYTKGMKTSGRRKIPVSNEASQVLEELKTLNEDCKYTLQGQGNAAFSMPENKINEHLRKYCKNAGCPTSAPTNLGSMELHNFTRQECHLIRSVITSDTPPFK